MHIRFVFYLNKKKCIIANMVVIPKKEIRDASLTIRLKRSTVDKLKKLSAKLGRSQADIIEHLIDSTFQSESKKIDKK